MQFSRVDVSSRSMAVRSRWARRQSQVIVRLACLLGFAGVPMEAFAKCPNMYQRIGAEREIARQYFVSREGVNYPPKTAREYCKYDQECMYYMNRACDYID